MPDERKARRAANMLTTPEMLTAYLWRIEDEEIRAETLDAMRPYLLFDYPEVVPPIEPTPEGA